MSNHFVADYSQFQLDNTNIQGQQYNHYNHHLLNMPNYIDKQTGSKVLFLLLLQGKWQYLHSHKSLT